MRVIRSCSYSWYIDGRLVGATVQVVHAKTPQAEPREGPMHIYFDDSAEGASKNTGAPQVVTNTMRIPRYVCTL